MIRNPCVMVTMAATHGAKQYMQDKGYRPRLPLDHFRKSSKITSRVIIQLTQETVQTARTILTDTARPVFRRGDTWSR